MTRAEWTEVAEALADLRREIDGDVIDKVAFVLALKFCRRSSRFNAEKFLELAGVPPG